MTNLRLKSLELNGYKTFASRTPFEFAGAVTAIVGPNGSGKSNIADALRWVLGEQSYAILRGRKTEDMIFAGAEKRPRAGMAAVTITFDNSEGWLPIDFSEVAVTRRAYRDGQNEYLINDQKVRLKDVTELLAQSGLSERTYTVIGQGLVDTALTLKSDERRRLFEEAAGLGLYRSRKEQSLRRLESTLRNLERAEDILAELKPRLRSLEKQAARAEEFSRLRADLRDTLRQWYGYHWNRAQSELREFRQEADSREENLGLARQKQMELSRELNELRVHTQELRVQLNEWQRLLAQLNAGREGASKGLAVADERQRALSERRIALDEEEQRLQSELDSLRARLNEAEQDGHRYQTELDEAQAKLEEARGILNDRQSVQDEYDSKGRELRERVLQLQAKQSQSAAQREMLAASRERMQNEISELQRTIAGIESDLQNSDQEFTGLSQQVSQSEKAVADKEEQLAKATSDLGRLAEEMKEIEGRRNDLFAKRARLQAELKGLEQAEIAAVGFAAGAKLLLQAAQEKRLHLGRGTLSRELIVPPEYEVAIAAALGTYLDAVLLTEDSEAALRELEGKEVSAALLPMQAISPNGRLQSGMGGGLVGVAADLVQVSADLKPAVESLLGTVLVADDRGSAQRLLREHPKATQVVTLRGEAFHRGGQIEVRASKSAAGLSRPRTERELQDKIAETEEALKVAETDVSRISNRLHEADDALAEIRENLIYTQGELTKAQQAINAHALEIEQLKRQREWFQSQSRTLDKEILESESKIQTLIAEEKALESNEQDTKQQVDAHSQSRSDLPMDEQHAQVAHWEMRLAVAQRALQEAQRRAGERQQALQRAETLLAAQEERRKELETQVASIDQEKSSLRDQEGTVGGEIEILMAKIKPAEEELAKSDEQLITLQTDETQALQAMSAAERAHTQAQISLARQQESLETLRTRIEDDFGLVEFHYDPEVSGPTPLPLGELVERLPKVDELAPELEETLKDQRAQIRRLGSVNPEAEQEFIQVKERVQSMQEQVTDLRAAEVDLKQVIAELDVLMEKEFRTTFDRVAAEFREIFSRLFNGGSAKLLLTEEADMATTGIDIEARLPGKRSQRLALLSGGERSLTATALVFSLLKASPTPFCVMDEVDAMLDEANVGRFTDLLRELSRETQFVVITHNRNTVQVADVIYGVTMGRDTASQVISLKLDEVSEQYAE